MITIYDCLQQYPHIVEKIIDYTFLVSVKCKVGHPLDEWDDTSMFEERSLYGSLDFRNRCIAFRFIDDFVLYGKFDKREIIKTISTYGTLEKKNSENLNDPANIIHNWWCMEEETTKRLMEEILVKMKSDNYSYDSYLHILNNFVSLTIIGFDEKYLSRLMEYMKNNIRHTSDIIELTRWHLSFVGDEDKKLYEDKVQELYDEIEVKNNINHKKELSSMLWDATSWGTQINNYVRSHKNIANNIFISKIDAQRIIALIDDSNSENIEQFRYAIIDFYCFSNIADYYMDDYPNLKTIYDGLNVDNPKYDLIKKKNIEWLKAVIGEKMDLLNPATVKMDKGDSSAIHIL